MFTHPQPNPSQVKNINDRIYNSKEEQRSRLTIYEKEYSRAKKHIQELKRYKPKGKLLDVGCSYGIAVKAAKDLGFDSCGIEPAKDAAQYARKKFHVQVIHGTLEKEKFPKDSFDVVSLFDVLEHVTLLQAIIKEIHRILKPGGFLVVQSPNIESYAYKMLKKNWNWLLVPNHLWHFSSGSLARILNENGFSVAWTTTEDDVYDFASNLKSTLHFPIFSSGLFLKVLRNIIYMFLYGFITLGTFFWHRLGRGGVLRIYAQKK